MRCADPRDRVVADVPDEPEHASRTQHAPGLERSRDGIDPVPRLSEQERIDGCVGERHPLCRPDECRHTVHLRAQLGEHSGVRVDRDDFGAELHRCAGELAGARADVGHAQRSAFVTNGLQHPLDGRRGVVGPPLLVGA